MIRGSSSLPCPKFNQPASTSHQDHWSLTHKLFALFLFFAPVYPMPGISVFWFISPGLVAFVCLFCLFQFLTRRITFTWNNFTSKYILIYMLLLLSELWGTLYFGFPQALYLGARGVMLLIFMVVITFPLQIKDMDKLIAVYCWSIAALSALTILQGLGFFHFLSGEIHNPRLYFGFNLPFYKAVGFDMSDGEFGLMVAPAFLYCLMQFLPGSGLKKKPSSLIMVLTMGMALLISQSRSTFLGLSLALFTLIFMVFKHKRLLILPLLVSAGIVLYFEVPQAIFSGLVGEGIYETNVYGRLEGFLVAWNAFLDSPLLGAGHEVIKRVTDTGQEICIHNHILDQMASLGAIGTIPLVMSYGLFFFISGQIFLKSSLPECKWLALWLLVSMIHIFTELMLYRGVYSEHLPFYFGLLALLSGISQRSLDTVVYSPRKCPVFYKVPAHVLRMGSGTRCRPRFN